MKNNKINSSLPLKTAVLFLIFNRPDTTRQVFEAIRQAKPPRLYVAADGPREGKLGEVERVEEVRTIATAVDWPCEVKTLFRDKNLGCKEGVSSAITWFFEQEEQGIIIEDDCLPHLDFFSFCESLLVRYARDDKVSVITGNNFQDGKWHGDSSYYFSKFTHCWGWATWRRSWKYYQGEIYFWPFWKKSNDWLKYISCKIERKYWKNIFDKVYLNQIDSWAYPWIASVWYNNGLTATPNVNLVSNIGFGSNSTHTKDKNSKLANIPTKELGTLKYPKIIQLNLEADRYTFDNHFDGKYLRCPYILIYFPIRVMRYFYRKITNIYIKKSN